MLASRATRLLWFGLFFTAACEAANAGAEDVAAARSALHSSAVGLALDVDNGIGTPVSVRAGQVFYVNQLDLRSVVNSSVDEGVAGLDSTGDFASLDWDGVGYQDVDFTLLPNPDGTFSRRRYYTNADWMKRSSLFFLVPVNASEQPTGFPIILPIGSTAQRTLLDRFFVRRLRAIQWTNDCIAPGDCTGADSYTEEALVELRWSKPIEQLFVLSPSTTAFHLYWTEKPGRHIIPVTQVATPTYAYGLDIDVDAVTPPRADGTYAPGSSVTFQVTYRDGAGNRLHPQGSLPTYAEVSFGVNEPGLRYYGAFFDPVILYWRHKHRERMMMAQIIGPAQDIQPIRTVLGLDALLGPEDTQTVGLPERDGVFSAYQTFPPSNDLFGGAFDPTHAGWFAPVSDQVTFNLAADAAPGTYLVTVKAKRVYLGEEMPKTTTIEIQVGSTEHTTATLGTGPCSSCHSQGAELGRVLHGNDNRAACAGCHTPLPFEHDAPVYVRTHYIHSRVGGRYGADLQNCATCHLDSAGVQRTSKSACLSCHTSYPADHVASFGPIESPYVGGGAESLEQCTSSCHTTHPGSGL